MCLTALFVICQNGFTQTDLTRFQNQMDTFLKSYVTEDGKVKYDQIKGNDKSFIAINSILDSTNYYDYSSDDLKAYWINAYNFIVIREVVRFYPIESVNEILGFFSNRQHQLGAQKHTLDYLENELIRKEFNDPRIHFALNCAAISCPPLLNEAFTAEEIDTQLDQLTGNALNDSNFVYFDSSNYTVQVSKIFFWFKEDFEKAGGVISFINKYREEEIPDHVEIKYLDYDWTLNELKTKDKKKQNLQNFTPSALFAKGQWEFKAFLNLYTQSSQFINFQKSRTIRSTYFTGINQFLIGVNDWLNVGANFWTKSVLVGGPRGDNPLNILLFPNDDGFRFSPIYFGPKLKVAPFKKAPRLSIQSTFLYPILNDYEGRNRTDSRAFLFLEFDRYLWINEVFFDKNLSDRWQVFLRGSIWASLPRDSYRQNLFVETPVSAFLSFFPNPKFTFYAQTEFWPKHVEDSPAAVGGVDNQFRAFNSFFVQSGLGAKYQLIPGRLELEALYTNFWIGSDQEGAGETYNLGIRIIR